MFGPKLIVETSSDHSGAHAVTFFDVIQDRQQKLLPPRFSQSGG